jgi:hypothetical protein
VIDILDEEELKKTCRRAIAGWVIIILDPEVKELMLKNRRDAVEEKEQSKMPVDEWNKHVRESALPQLKQLVLDSPLDPLFQRVLSRAQVSQHDYVTLSWVAAIEHACAVDTFLEISEMDLGRQVDLAYNLVKGLVQEMVQPEFLQKRIRETRYGMKLWRQLKLTDEEILKKIAEGARKSMQLSDFVENMAFFTNIFHIIGVTNAREVFEIFVALLARVLFELATI